MNIRDTFQRVMDITFAGEKYFFIVIYLDDMSSFSQSNDQHIKHLELIFQKFQRYGLSLNRKKSFFAMTKGKFLGNIMSHHGVRIDPESIQTIQTISLPRTKKKVQTFLGKINFLWIFIPNFIEIVKNITQMLKKRNDIKWTEESKYSFEEINIAIMEVPILISQSLLAIIIIRTLLFFLCLRTVSLTLTLKTILSLNN